MTEEPIIHHGYSPGVSLCGTPVQFGRTSNEPKHVTCKRCKVRIALRSGIEGPASSLDRCAPWGTIQ